MSNTPEQLFLIHWEKEAPHTAAIVRARKEARSDHYYVHYSDMKEMEIKARTLETQRDEALAEVERLRKALDAGPCSCEADYICARCRILTVPPTVTTDHTLPEIFEAHGLEWYRHDDTKPCPCDKYLEVGVFLKSGTFSNMGDKIQANQLIWVSGGIIGWRPADAPEKLERK